MSFDFSKDPFVNLEDQLAAASSPESVAAGVREPTAMTLATVAPDGTPVARTVLFKGLVRGGLSFYTNYESTKGQHLANNGKVSLLFYWAPLFRQIRIIGHAVKLTRAESEVYFASRPRLSQIGAWASQQSQEIAGPEVLSQRVTDFEKKFANQIVSCPPQWGGYHVIPSEIEFWFGRDGRLHDRFVYQREGAGWRRLMKSP